MALLQNSRYIKLEEDGKVTFYSSSEARLRHKNATPASTILAKYDEIIKGYESII
jgi:hypothetical protein